MNEKSLRVLEYTKIVAMLAEHATTPSGRKLCEELKPTDDPETIRMTQKETSDAVSRCYRKGNPSFSGTRDVIPSLRRLSLGSGLSITELLNISSLLKATARARSYGVRDVEPDDYDSLDERFLSLAPLTQIGREIDRCILSEEEIADDASAGLQNVRRKLAVTKQRISSQLASMLQSQRTLLQDAVVTMRDGRYCIPVKAEYKSQVAGMVHDQSASGSTIFIEPSAVVKLNNDLRELEIEEQKEIEKVLATLSNLCAPESEAIENDFRTLTELDFIFAKAVFARSYNGTEPDFNTDGIINLKKARHPLIPADVVVPIDISLGQDYDLLVITGPNTGGKTVTLKTVGLCTLMGQAGLFIPAFDHSKLAVFREVFADIGDEQSIEQSLSTFSSHIKNIAPILEQADRDTLVLFDELGAGTDPTEGAALAISILNFLHNMQVRTLATTHYSELKVYALSTDGVENASCEFDVATLRPTYRLLVGIPGKSNAFAISSKLGIPDYIIDDAKKHLSSDAKSFEDIVSELEHARVEIERKQAEVDALKADLVRERDALTAQQEKLASQKDKILEDARQKAQSMLQDTKNFVDETIRDLNKKSAGGAQIRSMEEDRTKVRERLDKVSQGSKNKVEPKKNATAALSASDLKIGDRILVHSLNLKGTVSSLPNAKGDFYAQMGILRSLVNIKDVSLLPDEPGITMNQSAIGGMGKIKMAKTAAISTEINLIGKTVDEALPEMEKYLDDAYLAHLEKVRVVHGRGTGALRNGVHQKLRKLKYVKEFHLGEYGEGDSGVTIVVFKER